MFAREYSEYEYEDECVYERSKTAMQHFGTRALLVEDNPLVQFLHKRMLHELGCRVDVASNVETALAMSSHLYDVILLDVKSWSLLLAGLSDK